MRRLLPVFFVSLVFCACNGEDDDGAVSPDLGAVDDTSVDATEGDATPPLDVTEVPADATEAPVDATEQPETTDGEVPVSSEVLVTVLLDGEPVADITVLQGGRPERWTTDAQGQVTVPVDLEVAGDIALMAAPPGARIGVAIVDTETFAPVTIVVTSFDTADNEAYEFQDPGVPEDSWVLEKCGHCHASIQTGWYSSPHRQTASNPTTQDLYRGTAGGLDEAECAVAGGTWQESPTPGSDELGMRCHLGTSVQSLGTNGACADCHAPGINGKLGGRDLAEAKGWAYDYGVHCDICHKIEAIVPDAPAGVAGRVKILRPTEPPAFAGQGAWLPLTFGPDEDIANPYMGSVPRPFFRESTICSGCHQLKQPSLVPGVTVDPARWPDGLLPVHTTFEEWQASPVAAGLPCQGCHMPPLQGVTNSADLQNMPPGEVGISGGWERPPGSVHAHTWGGPRSPESGLLKNAAGVQVTKSVDGDVLDVKVTVSSSTAGHALPTGEAMRSVLLLVEARCGADELVATGGDAVPDFGGALDRRHAGEGWKTWPGAEVGQVVRVVAASGQYHDYVGYGPFGDGSFDPAQKGLPIETVVGQATIVAVDGDEVTFDAPLPDGDIAYRGEAGLLTDGSPSLARAGSPGFAFARVMVGADGKRMVPHYLAVDVASDNRLLPGGSWVTEHQFAAKCPDPEVRAVLVYRSYPLALARERGWSLAESVIISVEE